MKVYGDYRDCVVSRECWCQSDYVSVDCGDTGRWFWPLSQSIRQTQEEESIAWIIPLRRFRAKLLLYNIGSVPGLLCSIISIICTPAFQPDKLPGSSQIVSKLYSSVHTQNIKLTLRECWTSRYSTMKDTWYFYKNDAGSIRNAQCNIWVRMLNLPEKRRWQGRVWLPSWRTTQSHNNNSICQNWCRHQSVPVSQLLPIVPGQFCQHFQQLSSPLHWIVSPSPTISVAQTPT